MRSTIGLRIALCGVLAGALTACVSVPAPQAVPNTSGQPSWVIQPLRSGSVIYGSGGSPLEENATGSLTRARQAATADLMTGLRVRVMAETQSNVTETNGEVERFYAQSVTSRVDDIPLDDVRLEDTWESPNGFLYALVSLDTEQAAARLRRIYQGAMPAINQMPNQLSAATQWDRFVAWHRLLVLGGEQQARNELHQLFVGRPIDEAWPAEHREWLQGYNAFISTQSIVVEPLTELAGQWRSTLTEPWSAMGFPLLQQAESGSPGRWRLRLSASAQDRSDASYQRQWLTVQASLYDAQGQLRWQHSVQSRGLAGTYERAQRQAVQTAAKALAQHWFEALSH